jgi:cellulose biosynthesis protein BcsQ
MSAPIIAFFSNYSGAGTTSLVYHLAWMFNDLGARVLAADLDPQASLTAALIDEDRLEQLWPAEGEHPDTIDGCLAPLMRGSGDAASASFQAGVGFVLLPGDLRLAALEDEFSSQWVECISGNPKALSVVTAFWRILRETARFHRSDVILMDLGPALGGINRAALIAADYMAVPVAPDLFSVSALRSLGPTVRRWRGEWQEMLKTAPPAQPSGKAEPIGYILQQYPVRLDRLESHAGWTKRIPGEYRQFVLGADNTLPPSISNDPNCIASLKHYRNLMPMAREARKPIFHLTVADGAQGAYLEASREARKDFRSLAVEIARRTSNQLLSLFEPA